MALEIYRRKRDFRRTPEPRGRTTLPKGRGSRFVVQKHAARRLHYDLRLEINGTYKSWAVPKGPSLNPRNRRLAVHVEDHPLEYGRFEGVIPKGEYGGGTVLVWDRGTWHPEGDALADYRRGHLRFRLDGKKLHGRFHLIRAGSDTAGKEQWLLIKSKDEHASNVDIVATQPASVQSGRNLEEIAAQHPRRAASLPRLLRPQLATLVDRIPGTGDWLHEIKYDGYRVLCRIERSSAQLYSRNGNALTSRMAAIARAVEALPDLGDAWLDGEVVALQADGRTSFPALQAALSEGRDQDLVYYLFDLPYANGYDLTHEPLLARKERLQALLSTIGATEPRLRYSDHVHGDGADFYAQACRFGLEGVISKRVDAPYRGLRTRDWVKTKCRLRQEFLVCGYTAPRGARQDLGALVLGVHDATGQLAYSGRTGTGLDAKTLVALRRRLEPLAVPAPPFLHPLPREARKDVTWVRPELVIEAELAGWTRDNIARQASFQGIREDKNPRDVVREVAQSLPPAGSADAGDVKAARATIRRLTNADKVLYPEQGLTKAGLAAYYAAVADWILPHIANRPLTLVRCPDGRHKHCFYQKHARNAPADLMRVPITENDGVTTAQYLALDSMQGLHALVQMGALEIHVWSARLDRLEFPDQLVLDLDPDAALAFTVVREAALLMRTRLTALGLESFLRTTGGKGLHVVVPLARRQSWGDVQAFAKVLAEDVARHDPDRYTTRAALAARRGKVFIDYLRNARGATTVANYSTRARAGAPVATPLAWEELTPSLRPDRFSVATVPARLAALARDPWANFNQARRAITAPMRRAIGVND